MRERYERMTKDELLSKACYYEMLATHYARAGYAHVAEGYRERLACVEQLLWEESK